MLYNYEVINPVTDNKKAFYDFRRKLFLFPTNKEYNYYVECARNDTANGGREYFILVGKNKFDQHCRKCHVDNYNRCTINVQGEIKDYIIKETEFLGNVDFKLIEAGDEYDVYKIE